MMKEKEFPSEQAESAIRACLAGAPFVRIEDSVKEVGTSQCRQDLIVKVRSAGGTQRLVVEFKTSGEPRLAREAIAFLRLRSKERPKAYAVFVAPYISPRTADLCREEGVGYADLCGNCRLCFDEVYIERQGHPNRFARKRELRKLFSPKSSRVLRVLLEAPRRAWALNALAREARVSIGLAWKVKELLADREWVSIGSDGILLKRPEELLAEWAGDYSFQQNVARDYHSMRKPFQLECALAALCSKRKVRYAFTGFSAAERMAPMVRYQRVFVYVAERVEELAAELDMNEAPSGANVTILTPYDDGVFYGARMLDDIQVVSPIQAYLDVFGNKARGEEAADALLREVIRPQW